MSMPEVNTKSGGRSDPPLSPGITLTQPGITLTHPRHNADAQRIVLPYHAGNFDQRQASIQDSPRISTRRGFPAPFEALSPLRDIAPTNGANFRPSTAAARLGRGGRKLGRLTPRGAVPARCRSGRFVIQMGRVGAVELPLFFPAPPARAACKGCPSFTLSACYRGRGRAGLLRARHRRPCDPPGV